jgi:hypothetical protein
MVTCLLATVVSGCVGVETATQEPATSSAASPSPSPSPTLSPSPTALPTTSPGLEISVTPRGDAGMPLSILVTPSDAGGPIGEATVVAAITDPSGRVRRFPIPDEGADTDPSGYDGIYGDRVWGTSLPGTYVVEVAVTGTGHDRLPFAMRGSTTVELAPGIDSDGDGVTDQAEAYLGFQPPDAPGVGEVDEDGDGLTLAQELAEGTNWMAPDTDLGGERDGMEVAAGRDPIDPTDDRPDTCYQGQGATSAWPTASYGPDYTFERDLALEAALPATILGYPTQRFSLVGDPAVQDPWLGAIPKVLVVCLGKSDADATVGVAAAPEGPVNGKVLIAVKIRGATGAQMEQAFRDYRWQALGLTPPEVRTVAGKTYHVYRYETPVYTTADTFYTLLVLPEGDGVATPSPAVHGSPAPTPVTSITIFDDIVRQLP